MIAVFNNIHIVPVAYEDYAYPSDEYLNELESFWNTAHMNSLAVFGVYLEMIKSAYKEFRTLPTAILQRFASTQTQLAVSEIIVSMCKLRSGPRHIRSLTDMVSQRCSFSAGSAQRRKRASLARGRTMSLKR